MKARDPAESEALRLSADPNITDLLQREHPPPPKKKVSRNRSGVGKIVDFRHLSRRISETAQDAQIAVDH